jgi:hypothetical protein
LDFAQGFVAVAAMFGESEIQQLYNAASGSEDVCWFEVAMNDAFGVRRLERHSYLHGKPQGLSRWERLLVRGNNRRPVNVLNDQIIRSDIINLANIGMIQRGNGFRFALETLAELRGADFDRDDPVQAGIPSLIDLAHAAGADGLQDLIRTEFSAAIQTQDYVLSAHSCGDGHGKNADECNCTADGNGREPQEDAAGIGQQ